MFRRTCMFAAPGHFERVMLAGFAAFVVAVPAAVLIPGNPVP